MNERRQIATSKELGEWYDNKYLEMGDGWNTPAEELNRHLDDLGVPVDSNKRLLDVGCGAGHFLVEAQKRVQAVGIEISEVGLEHCRRRGVNAFLHDIGTAGLNDVRHSGEQFDYIVSLGSLEHIVNLDDALDTIRRSLKADGKFYFYCPNELWKHFDQPNERTMTDEEWRALFRAHGLYTQTVRRWNDNTAFIGGKAPTESVVVLPPYGNKLNIGSGQRRFDAGQGWVNIDCVSRPPDQVPDLICDVGKEPLPYPDNTMDYCVLHQVYEHFGLGEGHGVLKECYRVLKPGGSLIITVPNIRKLAERWLMRQIDDYIFFVNLYGAYQGQPGDRHAWGYSQESLMKDVHSALGSIIRSFDWREIKGADISRDWWILGIEVVK